MKNVFFAQNIKENLQFDRFNISERQSGAQFGAAVSSLGDINKDGYNGTSFSYRFYNNFSIPLSLARNMAQIRHYYLLFCREGKKGYEILSLVYVVFFHHIKNLECTTLIPNKLMYIYVYMKNSKSVTAAVLGRI